jgi:hypothetical protein
MANLDLVPFAGYISDDSDFLGTLAFLLCYHYASL